jgi:hypothetical protein
MSKPNLHPLIEHARMLANFCPDLYVPAASTLVRVKPMKGRLLRFAREVAIRKECYYNALRIALEGWSFGNVRYVVGFAGKAYATEHAWVKIGKSHFDPTWELFLSIDDDYLPLFELDLPELLSEMRVRDSLYPPDLRDLMRWAKRKRDMREKNEAKRQTGGPLMGFIHPPNGDDI